jgi:hypothetical protein
VTSLRKTQWIVAAVLVAATLVASPTSTQADSVRGAPTNVNAPAQIIDPTVTRADPSITWDAQSRVYRMYTTQNLAGHVPEWESPNVTGPWQFVGDALPALPSWHGGDFTTWAPEVQEVNHVWTLWGSTMAVGGAYCLYRATAQSAAGPFVNDPRRVPCEEAVGGDIDPSMVRVGSQWWLLDKTNANAVAKPSTINSQEIGPDGMPFGPRYTLLTSDLPWENGLVEAPNLVSNPATNQWWLVFSAGNYDTATSPTYRISAAPCDGPSGPCHESRIRYLVVGNAQGVTPGEQTAFVGADGQRWISYNPAGFWADPVHRPAALVGLDFDINGVPYVFTPG